MDSSMIKARSNEIINNFRKGTGKKKIQTRITVDRHHGPQTGSNIVVYAKLHVQITKVSESELKSTEKSIHWMLFDIEDKFDIDNND